jgi:hypothetical protein
MTSKLNVESLGLDTLARSTVLQTVQNMARVKNVPLEPAVCERMAQRLAGQLGLCESGPSRLTESLGAVTQAINAELDVEAESWVGYYVNRMEQDRCAGGYPLGSATAKVEAILSRFKAAQTGVACLRWPDRGVLVRDFYGCREPIGPIFHDLPAGMSFTTYWLAGNLHRDPREGPAVHLVKDGIETEEYWFHGKRHRAAAEGPALREWNPAGSYLLEVYYHHGEKHREPWEGPAWRRVRDGADDREYFVHGKLHRDRGPAMVYCLRKDDEDLFVEEYFHHDQRHRAASAGPAVIYTNRKGERVLEVYHKDGLVHRDPAEGPALRKVEWGSERLEYWREGKPHRDEADGPAIIIRYEHTAQVWLEQYMHEGELHRVGGPASTLRGSNANIFSETWYRNGKLHRDPAEGPALTVWNEDGSVKSEEYWIDGKQIDAPTAACAQEQIS